MKKDGNVSLFELLQDPEAKARLMSAGGEVVTGSDGKSGYRLSFDGEELILSEEEWIALVGWRILMTHKNAFLELAK